MPPAGRPRAASVFSAVAPVPPGAAGTPLPEVQAPGSAGPPDAAAVPAAVGAARAGAPPPLPRQRASVSRQWPAADRRNHEFRDYVAARGPALLRIAYLLTGNLADAEDLLQSALAKTYQAWDRIQDRAAVDGYVRRTIVNTHISWWRSRRLEEYPTDEIPDRPIADPSAGADLQDTLRRAIDRLPSRMRAAVLLRFYEDLTDAEIAARLGVSLGTVKSTVSRAMAKLRTDSELTSG